MAAGLTRRAWMAGLAGLAGLGGHVLAANGQADADQANLFDSEGFRRSRYRAVVDRLPDPASRISLERALALHDAGTALFLDVLPAEGGWRDAATGQWALAQEHQTVPDALWFPETGRAPVDALLWAGLRERVLAERKRSPGLLLVAFCRADCWMGWNAARRLARDPAVGGAPVAWFAEGIDGWHDAARPLVTARPEVTPGTIRPKV